MSDKGRYEELKNYLLHNCDSYKFAFELLSFEYKFNYSVLHNEFIKPAEKEDKEKLLEVSRLLFAFLLAKFELIGFWVDMRNEVMPSTLVEFFYIQGCKKYSDWVVYETTANKLITIMKKLIEELSLDQKEEKEKFDRLFTLARGLLPKN